MLLFKLESTEYAAPGAIGQRAPRNGSAGQDDQFFVIAASSPVR